MDRFESRRGRRLLIVLFGAAALMMAGCGGDEGAKDSSFGRSLINRVDVVTKGGDFRGAMDATPAPDGGTVYFTATSSKGPGVFQVPASGGEAVPVAVGDPFRAPVGIAMSTDGRQLFVADPEASTVSGAPGAIFVVDAAAGDPRPVAGTEGTVPRGIEVVAEPGHDAVYFTGKDTSGAAAVLKVATRGGAVTTVVTGAPLASPDAVTVTKAGVMFVSDRGSSPTGTGAVYRATDGSAEKVADIRVPQLAGVTLTLDESTVLVSALSADGTDQVLLIDVASGRTGIFDETIGANRHGGGLHRAHDVNVFAWADVLAGPDRGSRVYVLRP